MNLNFHKKWSKLTKEVIEGKFYNHLGSDLCGRLTLTGGLYSKVVVNTGLTVAEKIKIIIKL